MDCTIVVDQDSSKQAASRHHKSLPVHSSSTSLAQQQQQQPTPAADVLSSKHDDLALPEPPAAAADGGGSGSSSPVRPRTYYIDWLRAFLTVLVVVHHCVVAYQSTYAWGAKKGDTALFLFAELFVNGNQAYFMTLFFFLSGLYVPGSYRRKGTWKFLLDRTLRLVVPCIVYSFLAPPFILWWNQMAKDPTVNPAAALGAQFRAWLKPGWPSTYTLPTGPVSCVVVLVAHKRLALLVVVRGLKAEAGAAGMERKHQDRAAAAAWLNRHRGVHVQLCALWLLTQMPSCASQHTTTVLEPGMHPFLPFPVSPTLCRISCCCCCCCCATRPLPMLPTPAALVCLDAVVLQRGVCHPEGCHQL
jgi:hypothetical protein